jgi:hypothetical protein
MTGIMRVAKEGIFSGLNNLDIYTILDEKFADSFGLTENDVNNALKEYELTDNIDNVKEWYNGYKFGNYEIYNPWSIIKYLNTKKLDAYWVNTSDNYLINEVLNISDESIYKALESLFNGDKIEKFINVNLTFDRVGFQRYLWLLLLFSGYLTVEGDKNEHGEYSLKIPNKEIYTFFKDAFIEKLTVGEPECFIGLLKALKKENIKGVDSFEYNLKKIFLSNISYHDITNKENFYHVFMLGITVGFENEYKAYSNIESGKGRPDLVLKPINKSKTGYIFEFKIADSIENFDKKLDEGIKQIEDKNYKTLLSEDGVQHILGIAIVFCGKELKISYKNLSNSLE